MANCKPPIRTYERKTIRKPLMSISLIPPVISSQQHQVQNDCFNNSENCNNSLNHDPFETTFDRIAKGAVVPPLPLEINQNDSWNSSSSNCSDADVINLVKSKDISHNSPVCKDIFNLTYESFKHTRKRKGSKKYIVGVISKPVHKKAKAISKKKDKIQSRAKIQVQKKRTDVQRQKIIQYEQKKSNRKCNKHEHYSNTRSVLKDAALRDISRDYNNKPLSQSVLKTDKDIMVPQMTSNNTKDSIATSKYILKYNQDIKPCFIKLDTCTVQDWCTLNRKKAMGDEQNVKHSYTNILQTSIDIFKVQNIIPQPSVVKHSIDEVNETNTSRLVLEHTVSKITSNCNANIDSVKLGTEKNKAHLIKDSFIRLKRLDIEKFTLPNKKKKCVASSTPFNKRKRPFGHSVLLSPIENIHDALNPSYKNSAEESASIPTSPKHKDSVLSLIASERYKINIANMQEQPIQVLLTLQELSMNTDSAVKVEAISFNEPAHLDLMQNCNSERNVKTESPYSLNISAGTDQSRSLFSDTINNCNHSMEDIIEHNMEEKCVTDTSQNKPVKISNMATSSHLPADLKQEKGLLSNNICNDTSLGCVTSPKIHTPIKIETSEDLNDIKCTRDEYKAQEEQNTEINSMKIICKNPQNETLNDNRDESSVSAVDVHMLLSKLQDPIRITKRVRYSKWHPSILSISKSLNDCCIQSNDEMFHYVATNDCSNVPPIENNSGCSKDAINSSVDYPKLLDDMMQQQHSNDTNTQVQRSVYLKPGKCWARSLSILNNVKPGSDLNKLCTGKGKKWRQSVQNILDMQKAGTSQSFLKIHHVDKNLSCEKLNTSISSLSNNRSEAANNGRFSKRISVRVVPNNNASIKCDYKNVSFFEAFGITVENAKLEKLYEKKLSIRNVEEYDDKNRVFESHSATAKDVVLQRCSQKDYLSFSDCFPDSYLDHCRKIGEGVYGEVFLYEHNDEKSVIKIIPIEGEQLINGEPQKKFNEILSEIVIAEELHNLRSHSTCRSSAFVEVRSIRCIIGRYPEKLVKLWKMYDDDKTSDNDCPSIFGEHQLYIALELCHGGEDLEAFVFQTAEEAYVLFLQTALALAVAEKAIEFEHRDLHWGNILISRTKEPYVYYNLDGKEIKFPSNNVKVSIIDYTLSRILYQGCCIYNDLALDPALFTAHGEYQFEIYRLMRDKIQNNWQAFEPYTNVLWLHYTLTKMITEVRYKRKNLKVHKQAINKLKELKDTILNYDSAYNFVSDSNSITQYISI